MGFLIDPDIAYDNNKAERNLRMMKVREKISCTFRSDVHGRAFCDIRSIISSLRKQSRNTLDCLARLITMPLKLGEDLGSGEST